MKSFILKIEYIITKIYFSILKYNVYEKIKNHWFYIYSIWISLHFKTKPIKLYSRGNLTIKGFQYIYMGDNCFIGRNNILTAWNKYGSDRFNPYIIIGDNCSFGEYNHITAINKIVIGNGCLTGRWVTITDNSHGKSDYENLKEIPVCRRLYSKGPVFIGNNVWIGDKATILPGVKIGDGCIIAANAVVTKDIPPYSIVAGNPGVVVKTVC